MKIGARLRSARKARGISLRDLAKELRVSPSAVSQWENDGTTPTLENRVDLAKALSIPFLELLPEIGKIRGVTEADSQALQLVQLFLRLPPPVRDTILMQALAVAAALEPKPPAK